MLTFATACSTTFNPMPCSTDTDCASGSVCELRETVPVCVKTEDAPIIIGSSSPVSGVNQALGTGMKLGITLALNEQNAKGGIRGRQLVLDFKDDGYDPPTAEAAARVFTDAQVSQTDPPKCPSTTTPEPDGHSPTPYPISATAIARGPNAVLVSLGNVGTPTMVRAAPVVVETGTLYFGAFTGAGKILRDTTAGPCAKYIFNVRASYAQEAQATTDLFKKKGVPDYTRFISFDQADTFGDAGYNGLKAAYVVDYGPFPGSADPTTPIARFRYTRNDDTSVPAQALAAEAYLRGLLVAQPSGNIVIGVMMTDTYGAGSSFIRLIRQWQFANDADQTSLMKGTRLKIYFSNVSFVGPNALAADLTAVPTTVDASVAGLGQMPYTQDVTVSQVVPNYQNDQSDVVVAYNKLIAAAGATQGFTSLEGYIATRVFIAGLLAHQGPFTPDSLISDFENLPDLSLGIGATAGFSPTNHQYSQTVWGTGLNADASFRNQYFWTAGSAIQFFE